MGGETVGDSEVVVAVAEEHCGGFEGIAAFGVAGDVTMGGFGVFEISGLGVEFDLVHSGPIGAVDHPVSSIGPDENIWIDGVEVGFFGFAGDEEALIFPALQGFFGVKVFAFGIADVGGVLTESGGSAVVDAERGADFDRGGCPDGSVSGDFFLKPVGLGGEDWTVGFPGH